MAEANKAANLKPMHLYSHASGPNPKKVQILLHALNIPYKTTYLEFGDGENGVKGSSFLKVNPNGRVPAIVDPNEDDLVVWESGAILLYLEKYYDRGNTVGGADKKEQVEINEWLFFQVSGLGPAQGQVNWFTHFHDSKNEDALKRYTAEANRSYKILDDKIGSGDWICCNKFTIADAAFYPWVAGAGYAKLTLPKNVKRWCEKMEKLDFVKAVYEEKK